MKMRRRLRLVGYRMPPKTEGVSQKVRDSARLTRVSRGLPLETRREMRRRGWR
jgi:hypothetical protein